MPLGSAVGFGVCLLGQSSLGRKPVNDSRQYLRELIEECVVRKTGLTRKFLHFSCPEGFFELMRLYGLILTAPNPGPNNVSIAALFEASHELLESLRLNVRLIGGQSRIAASWCKQ